MDEVEVFPYSIDTLRRLLSEKARAASEVINSKCHVGYFESYFDHLKAATIVVENEYIDRDFLEDFAAYYVRCFPDYSRKCVRLHFFRDDFSRDDLLALLAGDASPLTETSLRDSYLGFVVIKPLPQTIVGRTCLRTYEEVDGRRYPITRRYSANLFGIELSVNTLAFQEQDSVVAACATSALWSAFHGTGVLFQHAIPSPVEITKSANVNSSSTSRQFPNSGLSAAQMANAIRCVGLEPFAVAVPNESSLKSALYAYLNGAVPVLMCISLVDTNAAQAKRVGLHAIAVNGFRLESHHSSGEVDNLGILAVSQQINRIYAHDDGIGPFSRMQLDGISVLFDDGSGVTDRYSLSTSWTDANGLVGKIRAIPELLIVPLYHKIRIPFDRIHGLVMQFDGFVELLRTLGHWPFSSRLCWDMHLTTVNDFRKSLKGSSAIASDTRAATMLVSLPRFLWRAQARFAGNPVFDLLFDATDIEQGRCFVRAVTYDATTLAVMQEVAKTIESVSGISVELRSMLLGFRS